MASSYVLRLEENILCENYSGCKFVTLFEKIAAGLYIVPYSRMGKIIKGFGEREGKGRRKKEKKRLFRENKTFGSNKL